TGRVSSRGGRAVVVVPTASSVFPLQLYVTLGGRVEELLVAEELWNDHKKSFFFPFSSAATCTNHSLEVDQRTSSTQKFWTAIQESVLALAGSGADTVNATARCVAFWGLVVTSRHVAT
ncbi:hypothetical protein Taro_001047, partial [Colocasia esculenta]|nr:hypothetical protein [Colocasia esculenta]